MPETALQTARRQLDRAATLVDVNPNVVERLTYPAAVHEVTIPLEPDAAYVVALSRIAEAHERRGLWP